MTVHSLRELRRKLLYRFLIGDVLRFNSWRVYRAQQQVVSVMNLDDPKKRAVFYRTEKEGGYSRQMIDEVYQFISENQ